LSIDHIGRRKLFLTGMAGKQNHWVKEYTRSTWSPHGSASLTFCPSFTLCLRQLLTLLPTASRHVFCPAHIDLLYGSQRTSRLFEQRSGQYVCCNDLRSSPRYNPQYDVIRCRSQTSIACILTLENPRSSGPSTRWAGRHRMRISQRLLHTDCEIRCMLLSRHATLWRICLAVL
jgi:hypothetical protein